MNIFLKLIVLVLFVVFAPLNAASTDKKERPKNTLSQKIDSLIRQSLPNSSVGIVLQELSTQKILYQKNSETLFTPASTAKLFTAAAALKKLGKDYQFNTALKIKPETLIQNGTLKGDLYLHWVGDPSFTKENLKKLIQTLKDLTINTLDGDIIVIQTFQTPYYALGWPWDALTWYYAAPVTSIIIDENKIPITIHSNATLHQTATVALDKDLQPYIPFKANLMTVTAKEAESQCMIQATMDDRNYLNIQGCWPYQEQDATLNVALRNPELYAQQLISEYLTLANIKFSGKILSNKDILIQSREPLKELTPHYSEPLSELLKKVLQDSNNIYSDSVVKKLGEVQFEQGSFQAGTRAIKKIISESSGKSFANSKLMDGSGLSSYDLITPKEFAQLLLWIHQDPALSNLFKNTLAEFGATGTLKGRNIELGKGKIQAKTGTISNASGLIGYLTTENKKEYLFVILENQLSNKESAKQFENELCQLFLKVL